MPQRLLTAALLLALGVYAWRGWYTRYVTDDYCTAATLNERGFAEAMQFHRDTWSGRYSYYAAKALLESIGPATARVVPGLMIVLLAGASYWTIRRLLSPARWIALTAACAIAFAAVDATPDPLSLWGAFAWETGVVTYMLPVVLLVFWLGLFACRAPLCIIASFVLAFMAAGFSETSLAAQGALTFGLLLVTWKTPGRWISVAAFAATLIGLAVMLSAPGNDLRIAELPPRASVLSAVALSLRLAYRFIGSHVFVDGAALLLVIAVGFIGSRIPRKTAAALAAVALGAYVISFLPSAWMLSAGPPPRALHVSMVCLIAALFIGALTVRVRWANTLVLLCTLLPLWSAWSTMKTIPEARRGAAQIDAIDAELRPQRGQDVILKSRWALANRFLVNDPTHWSNRCVCRYYGLRSLRVTR